MHICNIHRQHRFSTGAKTIREHFATQFFDSQQPNVFFLPPRTMEIYGIFMVNTWRNSCCVCSKREVSESNTKSLYNAHKYGFRVRKYSLKEFAQEKKELRTTRAMKKKCIQKFGELPVCHLSTRWRQLFSSPFLWATQGKKTWSCFK